MLESRSVSVPKSPVILFNIKAKEQSTLMWTEQEDVGDGTWFIRERGSRQRLCKVNSVKS